MKRKAKSTYEEFIKNKKQKKILDKEYREFLISELLLAAMEEDHISIRKLAKEAGVSPSLIQDLRTGKKDNLTFRSFSNIIDALGYDIVLEKRKRQSRAPRKFRIGHQRRNAKTQGV